MCRRSIIINNRLNVYILVYKHRQIAHTSPSFFPPLSEPVVESDAGVRFRASDG